jgi:ubiquinol-cytochrome c reductase cytochrome b subunit
MGAPQNVYDQAGTKVNALVAWIDARFPLSKMWKEHASEYYAPKNFNFWYYFGSSRWLVLALQIITGIFLTMNYKPSAAEAFASVEYIMRDVEWGWLIRYMHSTGASAFFIVVYLHMFRALLYGSYKAPRELLWLFGMLIYLCADGRGLHGLPAALGQHVLLGRAGDRVAVRHDPVSARTRRVDPRRLLHLRHHAEPLLRAACHRVAAGARVPRHAHIMALHEVGSNNPGRHRDQEEQGPGRHPEGRHSVPPVLHRSRTSSASIVFIALFCAVLFFAPDMGGYFLEHAEFRAGQHAADAGPHRAGVVLHAVLRDAARRPVPEQFWGVADDGRRHRGVRLPALAGQAPRSSRSAIAAGCTSRSSRPSRCRSWCSATSACSSRRLPVRSSRGYSRWSILRSSCSCRGTRASMRRSRFLNG